MVKDFQPYSNLWLAANKWFTDYPKWLNGPFGELSATDAEKFVEDSIKTLSGVLRYFKDRDIEPMCKITDIIKVQLDQFRPKVPLMVALRKEGMKERHWQQISDKVNFVVKPTGDEFCFQDILDMNLLEHSEMCCEIGERAEKEFNIENML
jgi:dynein heavy chain